MQQGCGLEHNHTTRSALGQQEISATWWYMFDGQINNNHFFKTQRQCANPELGFVCVFWWHSYKQRPNTRWEKCLLSPSSSSLPFCYFFSCGWTGNDIRTADTPVQQGSANTNPSFSHSFSLSSKFCLSLSSRFISFSFTTKPDPKMRNCPNKSPDCNTPQHVTVVVCTGWE